MKLRFVAPAIGIVSFLFAGTLGFSQSIPFQIHQNRTATFKGVPFQGVGLQIDGDPQQIAEAIKAGFTKFCVNLPASGIGWKEAITALENGHAEYVIRINSLAPMCQGWSVHPAGNRIGPISDATEVSAVCPGADKVFSLFGVLRDGSIDSQTITNLTDNKFSLAVDPGGALEHVVILYPHQTSFEMPDWWEGADRTRDSLLHTLKTTPPGPGCRGIINPFGVLPVAPNANSRFVPDSAFFRADLNAYLTVRYPDLDTAMRTWAMGSSNIDSFEKLARSVPLWNKTKGPLNVWDPVENTMATVSRRLDAPWNDINTVIARDAMSRFHNIVASIQQLIEVPVVQEWHGWGIPYEGEPQVNGVAYDPENTMPPYFLDDAARATSSVSRWNQPGWVLCSGLPIATNDNGAIVSSEIRSLHDLGYSLVFLKPEANRDLTSLKPLTGLDLSPSGSDNILYFPENATNPAQAVKLSSGTLWLPSPDDGNRLDLGSIFQGYRIRTNFGDRFVIWQNGPAALTDLLINNPKGITIRDSSGIALPFKVNKKGVEVSIGNDPVVIDGALELPVPVPSVTESELHFAAIKKAAADLPGFSLAIASYESALKLFDGSPGASYLAMQAQLNLLVKGIGSLLFINGGDTSYASNGSANALTGTAGSSAFSLHNQILQPGKFGKVEYRIESRGSDVDTWVGIKADPATLAALSVSLNGNQLSYDPKLRSFYGTGFGWLHLGRLNLPAGTSKLQFLIGLDTPFSLDIDCILITRQNIYPTNTLLEPYINLFSPKDKK